MNRIRKKISLNFLHNLIPQEHFLGLVDNEFNSGPIYNILEGIAGKCLACIHIYQGTQNRLFLDIAHQFYIHLVENWSEKLQGWPNHQMHINNLEQHNEYIRQYSENNFDFFSGMAIDHSFESGNAGIAYTVDAYESLTENRLSVERNIDLKKYLLDNEISVGYEIDPSDLQALIQFDIKHLRDIWIRNLLPRSLRLVNSHLLQNFDLELSGIPVWKYDEIFEQVETCIQQSILPTLDKSKADLLLSALALDDAHNQFRNTIVNKAVIRAQELYVNTLLPKILSTGDEQLFSSVKGQLNENLSLHEIDEERFLLLAYLSDGLLDVEINTFEYLFLSKFEEPQTGLGALTEIATEQGINAADEIIRNKSIRFIRKMLFLKVILPA